MRAMSVGITERIVEARIGCSTARKAIYYPPLLLGSMNKGMCRIHTGIQDRNSDTLLIVFSILINDLMNSRFQDVKPFVSPCRPTQIN